MSARSPLHRRSPPVFFHLLWEDELDDLRPLLRAVAEHRAEVLDTWHRLYEIHFGTERSLSRSDFLDIYGADLTATTDDLLAKDVAAFQRDVSAVGERLAARGVPFAEVVASIHLFEESAHNVFPPDPPKAPDVYLSFDKVSHCRMMVLAESWVRTTATEATERIRALERDAAALPRAARRSFHGIVGASPSMQALYERIAAAARTRGTVLIVGESGTGKELVARAVHECGPDPGLPFVALNCAAIPRDLIESELFGYRRGAFSGATMDYLGLFRAADGGTIFLDEITEMGAETQSKLLRAIQERTVRPIGSTHEIPVDVRLVASTNRDPEQAVAEGKLRRDLYYRLQVNVLHVPPLRERRADVALLAEHFLALVSARLGHPRSIAGIEPDAIAALEGHDWPGNVRELANAIESAVTFGSGPRIGRSDLPAAIAGGWSETRARAPLTESDVPSFAEAERSLIRRALEATGGNKLRAAALLGISRKKLYAKIAKYRIG